MMRYRWLLVALVLTIFSASLSEGSELVGVWSIESVYTEVKSTGEKKNPFGDRPRGYIAFTLEKRLLTVVTASERKKPETDDDRAAAFRSTYAVAGRYRVEGDKYIVRIETAWNDHLVGAEHARTFRVDGDRLTITSDWAPSAILPGRPEARGVSIYKRVTAD